MERKATLGAALPRQERLATMNPLVSRDRIKFRFVEPGPTAPADVGSNDEIWLDVGNALRTGVIDHHQIASETDCSTGLVPRHQKLVSDAVNSEGDADVVIVLHQHPDLDCLGAAYLATHILTTGKLPAGTQKLVDYVARVDQGYLTMTVRNPYTLYPAYSRLLEKAHKCECVTCDQERWSSCMADGFTVIDYVLQQSIEQQCELLEIDAYNCPALFTDVDRKSLLDDEHLYEAKLADPATVARSGILTLPTQLGETVDAETLLVRDVQGIGDADSCVFFKVWARSDEHHAPTHKGFCALSVFMPETTTTNRRCIISVRPEDGVNLSGLGARLDREESNKRISVNGVDDRTINAEDGSRLPSRPGYENADPWYDGRGHGYTIVDSPRSGTILTADEIESSFVKFGHSDLGQFVTLADG